MARTDLTVELWYSGGWNDVTTDVRIAPAIVITRGKPDQASRTPPATLGLTFNNRDGKYSPRNPGSSLYGLIGRNTPICISVDDLVRFVGEVESWPARWDVSGTDVWVSITANGLMRRLNAPGTSKLAYSPLRRFLTASPVVGAYWSMEGYSQQPEFVASLKDGVADATINTNANPGIVSPFDWQGDASLPGSGPLPALENNQTAIAGIASNFTLAANPSIGMALWSHTGVPSTDGTQSINTQALQSVTIDHGPIGFSLALITFPPGSGLATVPDDGEVQISVSSLSSGSPTDTVAVTDLPYFDRWRLVSVRYSTSGGDVAVSISLDGEVVGTGTLTGVALGTITRSSINAFEQDTVGNVAGRISIGHPVVLSGTSADIDAFAADAYEAGYGYAGELAADRIERLCDEEGISVVIIGDESEPCGAQPIAPVLDVMFAAQDVDGGMLFETRNELGLTYRTRQSLYAQETALTLDYTAGDEVAPPLEPVDDTDNVINDVTVTRLGGSSARVVQETGPLNVQEPADDPDGVGRYAADYTLNLAADSEALDQATWRVALGTWDDTRFPTITVDTTAMVLGDKVDLADLAALVDVGDRVVITNPPAWLAPHDIEQLVPGYQEIIEPAHRQIVFNAIPSGPYDVARLDEPAFAKLDSPASTLASAIDADDTSLSVAVASGYHLWTTTAAEFTTDGPLYIVIRGEQMRVTNITGAASPQTFTVVRPTNGAAHPAGAEVHVWHPFRVGL